MGARLGLLAGIVLDVSLKSLFSSVRVQNENESQTKESISVLQTPFFIVSRRVSGDVGGGGGGLSRTFHVHVHLS